MMDVDFIDLSSDEEVLDTSSAQNNVQNGSEPSTVTCEDDQLQLELFNTLRLTEPAVKAEITAIFNKVRQEWESSEQYIKVNKELFDLKRELKRLNGIMDDLIAEREDIRRKIKIYGRPEHRWFTVTVEADWDEETRSLVVPEPVQRVVLYTPDTIEEGSDTDICEHLRRIRELGLEDSDDEILPVATVERHRPKMGQIEKLDFAVGTTVLFAMAPRSLDSIWKEGIVDFINFDDTMVIKFDENTRKTVKPEWCTVKQVQRSLIKGGQRVVAQFREPDSIRETHLEYYAGFVVEEATTSNSFRYLILFDNDLTSYVTYDQVFVIFTQSKNDYIDYIIRPKNDELASFLTTIFEKDSYMISKVVAKKGDKVRVKVRDKFPKFEVLKRDCSVMKVRRHNSSSTNAQTQWIYRGSYKLEENYRRLFPERAQKVDLDRQERKSNRASRRPRTDANSTTVEYSFRSLALNDLREQQENRSRDSDSDLERPKGFKLSKEIHISDGSTHYVPTRTTRTIIRHKSPEPDYDFEGEPQVQREQFRRQVKEKPQELFNPNCVWKKCDREAMPYFPHDCDHLCLNPGHPENFDESKHRGENPFIIPLLYGWERHIRAYYNNTKPTRSTAKRKINKEIVYVGPCGRSMTSVRDVKRYLRKTKSKMWVDYFTFDVDVELYREMDPFYCYLTMDDFSEGLEKQPISVVNCIEAKKPEHNSTFEYIADRQFERALIFDNVAKIDGDIFAGLREFKSCCSCADNCRDAAECECQMLTYTASFVIPWDETDHTGNRYGYVDRRLDENKVTAIYECNEHCACNDRCQNRLVQLGGRNQLQLYNYPNKGWGIRTLHDIPKGTFICTYAAEILTPEEGDNGDRCDMYFADMDTMNTQEDTKRQNQQWFVNDYLSKCESEGRDPRPEEAPMLVDFVPSRRTFLNEEQCYVLDAKFKGNVGRFFNHSCDPNCVVQNVFIDTHDLRFPEVSLFTFKHVKALEELTWDYNYEPGSVEGKYIKCHCKARNCRGRLL